MKKLMNVAAMAGARVLSAKDNAVNPMQNKEQGKMGSSVCLLRADDWIIVRTSCGRVFYLDGNDYTDCYECLQEHARHFTDAQCGQGASFELPY